MVEHAPNKSNRSIRDASSPIGMGSTDALGRVVSSLYGGGPCNPIFEQQVDVPNGGIVFTLPFLLSMNLLRYAKYFFSLPRGFYRLDSVFLLLLSWHLNGCQP